MAFTFPGFFSCQKILKLSLLSHNLRFQIDIFFFQILNLLNLTQLILSLQPLNNLIQPPPLILLLLNHRHMRPIILQNLILKNLIQILEFLLFGFELEDIFVENERRIGVLLVENVGLGVRLVL